MEDNKSITIGKLDKSDREFIAFFRHEFLQATFSVSFKDNIMGAVALNSFIEMIQQRYSNKQLDLVFQKNNLDIKTEHILKSLTLKEAIK